MKVRDELRLTALRQIKTTLDRHEKDQRKPLDEASEQKLLETLAKQHYDSIDMFLKGDRQELAVKEQAELRVIETYLLQEATDAELDAAVESAVASANNIGGAMKLAKVNLSGKRVDGRLLSEKIKAKLLCGGA